MEAFSAAGKFDVDALEALESTLINQIDLATGAHLVVVFEAHAAWAAQIV